MIDSVDLEQIVAAGIAAPSADNSQPWLYRPRADGLDLIIDSRRAVSPSNAGYVLSDLALGAVIENMCLRAADLGYAVNVNYFPALETDPMWVAQLSVTHENAKPDELVEVISRRHTDRRFPFKGPVSVETLQSIASQAAGLPGVELLILDENVRKKTGLHLLRLAETMRFRFRSLHEELFSHIRWEAGWKDSCPEGLPPAALAVEPPMRPMFKSLRHWSVMSALNHLGTATLLGFRAAYLPARMSPTLALLTVQAKERMDMVQAGRALQRVWLQATLAGLSVQPFAAAGLFTLDKMNLGPYFQRDTQQLKTLMASLCTPGRYGLVFLRLGYPPRPTDPPRSQRRPVTDFLATN